MKFSLGTLRNKKAPLVEVQPAIERIASKGRSKEDQQAVKNESVSSIAWAIAVIAWALAIYLMERERQRAQVEIARLQIEAKKQIF